MKLWIDDIRTPPIEWHWAKNYKEAIDYLKAILIEEISFDHDLGEEKTGYDIAKWIEEQAAYSKLKRMKWKIHSANTVGRARIEMAMESAERFWNEN